jgi:hypothetical protein
MRRSFNIAGRALGALTIVGLAYGLVLAHPEPMFPYLLNYRNYEIRSDKPIPPQITQVLDDIDRRLQTSNIHKKQVKDRIFFCNAPWRLWLYSGMFSTKVGGSTHLLTQNIFMRASDIPANRIHSPGPGPIADAVHRPLSYYLAHEVTHADVYRRYSFLTVVRFPQWLSEGYPDYVAKGGDFDFDDNRALFLAQRPELDFHKSGLYRGFHLKVAYLLDKRHLTTEQIFANPPGEATLDAWLHQYRQSEP